MPTINALYGSGYQPDLGTDSDWDPTTADVLAKQNALYSGPGGALRSLRDAIPESPNALSILNMGRSGLGTMANWLQGTPEIGPDTLAPMGLAAVGAPAAALRMGRAVHPSVRNALAPDTPHIVHAEPVEAAERFGAHRPQERPEGWPHWGDEYPDYAKAHMEEAKLGQQWNELVNAIQYPNGSRNAGVERWQAEQQVMQSHPELAERYREAKQWHDLLKRKMQHYKGGADPKQDYKAYWDGVLDTHAPEDRHAWFNEFRPGEQPASRETIMRAIGGDLADQMQRRGINTGAGRTLLRSDQSKSSLPGTIVNSMDATASRDARSPAAAPEAISSILAKYGLIDSQ